MNEKDEEQKRLFIEAISRKIDERQRYLSNLIVRFTWGIDETLAETGEPPERYKPLSPVEDCSSCTPDPHPAEVHDANGDCDECPCAGFTPFPQSTKPTHCSICGRYSHDGPCPYGRIIK